MIFYKQFFNKNVYQSNQLRLKNLKIKKKINQNKIIKFNRLRYKNKKIKIKITE